MKSIRKCTPFHISIYISSHTGYIYSLLRLFVISCISKQTTTILYI